jgi:Asp-tRNA(Asn)/Glu-tRNA(Gln) amidotransferase A subunit family amidase
MDPTIGVMGPMASNLRDLALTYAVIAGPDEKVLASQL